MNLIIDNREKDLIEYCEKNNFEIQKENLILGDITVRKENKDIIIIERKTINDLLASLKDGRYREQKCRLLKQSSEGTHIYYLIEGNISMNKNIDLIHSCIINTMFRDNLKIIYTSNLNETFIYLSKILKKSNEFENVLINNKTISNSYIDVIKTEKKKNMTKENCFMAMLKQIPGVSSNTAIAIHNKYSSFYIIISTIEKLENIEDKELFFKDIQIGKKKLGKILSKRIYDYLF